MIDTHNEPLFKLESSTTLPLTQQTLTEFRALPASITERVLKEPRVARLKAKFEAGYAIPFLWASAKLDGKEYRVNGQHSSAALSQMNGSFPEGLQIHRDVYNVRDGEGLIALYRQFDDRYSGRDATDVATSYLKSTPEIADVDVAVAKRAVEGIAWYDGQVVGGRKVIGDDRYDALLDPGLHPFILWQGELFSSKTKELAHLPVIGGMWATWQINEALAKEFWGLVARGGPDNEDDSDPTRQLDDALRKMQERTLARVKPGAEYAGCIHAWNAWRSGTRPKSIRFDNSKGFPAPAE